MISDDKIVERKLLIKRAFALTEIFEIGKELGLHYFSQFVSGWETDADAAALEIAQAVSDTQLQEIFKKHETREWAVFRGKHYTFENGILNLHGSLEKIGTAIAETAKKYGKDSLYVLKAMVQTGGGFGLKEYTEARKQKIEPYPILSKLEQLKVVVPTYKGEEYHEWKILEETLPFIRSELGLPSAEYKPITAAVTGSTPTAAEEKVDYLEDERRRIEAMEEELNNYLNDLVKNRLIQTIKFGKTFSASYLADYLQNLFGQVLYFDGFLSILQQYAIADIEIVNPQGRTGMRTGWSFALFGEPGTGKSFSTRDLILGVPDGKIKAHGVPGRNRYCGGITPARFIRIGQAYTGRTFNFIVPEFNDWFRYSGMVDVLKIAMERGEIKHELHREIIGPYRFNSYFSVNYNTQVMGKGYAVTIGDPNFNAIEDRMICRLHRLTKERFVEIAKSQMRLALGEVSVDKGAQQIRDHVTLTYAIETGHPLVRGRFPPKPVMITPQLYEAISKAREAILKRIPGSMKFSARLESNMVKFACAASLLSYFNSDMDYIPVSEDAIERAVKLYVEEASVRSREEFQPEEVIAEIFSLT
ncbi:MAG: hypothetical protein NWE94_02190 [Candidatus Bathyarchaeota archaeon]|nr:hypothetical protein [Candidatus Bathyarchaeota archaeon]